MNLLRNFLTKGRSRRSRRGVAALEFALTLPIWFTLLFMGTEAGRLMLLSQRIDRVAYAVTDMATQSDVLSPSSIATILSASAQIMQPFSFAADGIVVLSSVSRQSGQPARIDWQQAGGGSLGGAASHIGMPPNVAVLPGGLTINENENIIVAEVFYNYVPIFPFSIPGVFTPFPARQLYRVAVYKPRLSPLSVLGP